VAGLIRMERVPGCHRVSQNSRRRKIDEERLRLARETHELLHQVYGDAARQLGHIAGTAGPGPSSGEQDRPQPGGGGI